VGPGAVLRGDLGSIRVGHGSNVQENCVLHTFPDTSIILHPNSHIGHACILHGCEVCSNVLVGMGSVLPEGVKVNSDCLIGARSFIELHTEIPAGSLVIGAPAKVVGPINEDHLRQIVDGRAIYQELTRRYLKAFKKIPHPWVGEDSS
jgi:phenylacetic acid degradation protein